MRQGTLYLPPRTKMPYLAAIFSMLATVCSLFTEFHSVAPTLKLVAAVILTLSSLLPTRKQYFAMLLPAGMIVLAYLLRIFRDISALPAFFVYLVAFIAMFLTSSGIIRGKGAVVLFCGLAPVGYGIVSLFYNLHVIAETQTEVLTKTAYRLHQIGCLYPLLWGMAMLILTFGLRPYIRKKPRHSAPELEQKALTQ